MKTHKTKIFNSDIDINYEEKDKVKLFQLIENLKTRLNKYKHLQGKVTDIKVLIFVALSIEDELLERKKIISENIQINEHSNKNKLNIEKLSKEIIFLKDKINLLESKIDQNNKSEMIIEKEIDNINDQIENFNNMILSQYNE